MKKWSKKGYKVIIGGAEDRRDRREILRHIVNLTSVQHAVIIPTASSYPSEVYENYREAFRALDVPEVDLLDIRYADEANDKRFVKKLEPADLIFFSGGDQETLYRILKGSKVLKKIKRKHNRGATLAGTSAGATAIGNPMIAGGNGNNGFEKESTRISQGFGFIDSIVIDTHFMARARIPRLAQALAATKAKIGIGLCENTAAVIAPDRSIEVIGSAMVTIMNSKRMRFTNYFEIERNDLVAIDGVRMSFLTKGMTYDLRRGVANHR